MWSGATMFHIFSPDTLGLVTLKLGGGGDFFLADLVNLEYGILFFATFSAILRISRDQPVVSGGRNQSTRQNPTPNPESLVTFSHVPAGTSENMSISYAKK